MAWARTGIHVQEYGTRHQHDFHLTPYFLESVLEKSLQPHLFSNSAIAWRTRCGFAPLVRPTPTLYQYMDVLFFPIQKLASILLPPLHNTCLLLPPSWFIGPLCSLCQILTKDLTKKMLMHVKKNYLIGSYLNIVFKNIMFGDMRKHFISLIYGLNLARNIMGTNKPRRR